MIKLNYRLTYTFTGKDIGDGAIPDIEYTALINQPGDWFITVGDFIEGKHTDVELAYKIIAGVIDHITVEGETWPMTVANVSAWRDSIEAENPGLADDYFCKLAISIYNYHYQRQRDRLKNSVASSKPEKNGNGGAKSRSVAKQAN